MIFEEQIISKDTFFCLFLRQMEAVVLSILQIFFATCIIYIYIIWSFPTFSWYIFSYMSELDQSYTSENI